MIVFLGHYMIMFSLCCYGLYYVLLGYAKIDEYILKENTPDIYNMAENADIESDLPNRNTYRFTLSL